MDRNFDHRFAPPKTLSARAWEHDGYKVHKLQNAGRKEKRSCQPVRNQQNSPEAAQDISPDDGYLAEFMVNLIIG